MLCSVSNISYVMQCSYHMVPTPIVQCVISVKQLDMCTIYFQTPQITFSGFSVIQTTGIIQCYISIKFDFIKFGSVAVREWYVVTIISSHTACWLRCFVLYFRICCWSTIYICILTNGLICYSNPTSCITSRFSSSALNYYF